MPVGVVGRVGPRMCSVGGVLIAAWEGQFYGAAHCSQWGIFLSLLCDNM